VKSRLQLGATLEYELQQVPGWEETQVIRRSYDHHLTHAAAACFTSPFDSAMCAVVDGYGEGRSLACYAYEDSVLRDLGDSREDDAGEPQKDPHASLGIFFQEVCELCGFGYLTGDEWKVMGLAAYGEHDERLYRLFRELITVDNLHFVRPSDMALLSCKRELYSYRRKHGDPAIAAANLAHTGQKVLAESLYELLCNLHRSGNSDNLVLAGGCALNSSANGEISKRTLFRNLYVCSAPADDGNAIGAALLAHREDHPNHQPKVVFQTPYLGAAMQAGTVSNLAKFSGLEKLRSCNGEASRLAAELLAQGKIIGWIQGRAEFGPRALGNRSILADPRSVGIKDAINTRVKFREEFRPFAPAILHEFGAEYFERYEEAPYMERTLKFRPEVVARVRGAVHEDGTGRLQTVKRAWNSPFYELIRTFYELTGVPLVINTSFNVMGKPIAHSVEDVIAVFFTTGLDAVFIGDLLIEK
jgi:carbamoyltransferase